MTIETLDDPMQAEVSEETIEEMAQWVDRVEDLVQEMGVDGEKIQNNFNEVTGNLLSIIRTDLSSVKRDKLEEELIRLRANVSLLEDYLMKLEEDPTLLGQELDAQAQESVLDVKAHIQEVLT